MFYNFYLSRDNKTANRVLFTEEDLRNAGIIYNTFSVLAKELEKDITFVNTMFRALCPKFSNFSDENIKSFIGWITSEGTANCIDSDSLITSYKKYIKDRDGLMSSNNIPLQKSFSVDIDFGISQKICIPDNQDVYFCSNSNRFVITDAGKTLTDKFASNPEKVEEIKSILAENEDIKFDENNKYIYTEVPRVDEILLPSRLDIFLKTIHNIYSL